MAGNDKLIALVNSFASAVLSVGREVGLNITLNKAKVSPGIKVSNICTTALIGVVGAGSRGTINIMLDSNGFSNIIKAMSGGMIMPQLGEDVSMSVIGELSNMIGGRALVQSALGTVDVTPPQLIVGENIRNVTKEDNGMRSFTLPFMLEPSGGLYLVLSFKID
ncbi:MAG: chemotaxis protein CheX [Synergistaceae bacterium]|nr:chemotaxis protein CheX [Synergistaceae bacterium]